MEPQAGMILEGKVTTITNFGAFVSLENRRSGLVHISEIANAYVNNVRDYLEEGQTVKVLVLSTDNGKINLSIKKALSRSDSDPSASVPSDKDAANQPDAHRGQNANQPDANRNHGASQQADAYRGHGANQPDDKRYHNANQQSDDKRGAGHGANNYNNASRPFRPSRPAQNNRNQNNSNSNNNRSQSSSTLPPSGDQAFEDKLKRFLSSSEGKIADLNRGLDGKRGGGRRKR